MRRLIAILRTRRNAHTAATVAVATPTDQEVKDALYALRTEVGLALDEVDLRIAGQKLKDYTDSNLIDYKLYRQFHALAAHIDYRIAEHHSGNLIQRRRP